mmetsp:Transcript_9/g.18  ORF Transcript_9/g.18 Transcript_9/m.18 type:complete len:334 (-) Transcript_9:30-1031(-)
MSDASVGIGVSLTLLFIAYVAMSSIHLVRERQVIIIERLGKFNRVLDPGLRMIIPFIERPKLIYERYWTSNMSTGEATLHETKGSKFISTQDQVMDFPSQKVITRDNAAVSLDAMLTYNVVSPVKMAYGVQNLPHMLAKLLQGQIRNVAGSLDVDQIVEDQAAMDRVSGLIDSVAVEWGVKVVFVKFQGVEMGELDSVLARKKQADLNNKEVIIQARGQRQTTIIEAEGNRDRMIKEAEGEAQRVRATARGRAQAIINEANAEASSVREISRAVSKHGEDPVKFLLATKYLDALQAICAAPNTEVNVMPHETAFLQTARDLGFSTVLPQPQRR